MDIYLINIKIADKIPEELLQKFNLKSYTHGKIHSLTYLMIDRILKEVYKIQTREIVFNSKKPILKSGGKYLSVSHSNEYIALAFSDNNCGVDIEKIKDRNFKAISARMGFNSKSLEDFYYNWTEFEASYKLGEKYSIKNINKIDNYILTAVSTNPNEKFELYNSVY